MHHLFIQYVYLTLIILALVMVANKLRIAYPIVLVLGGLALSFVASFSHIAIQPALVFFIFLPPLLYEAAWQVSWKEFWKWRRVIGSFAFPVVFITACAIAWVSHWLIPDFTWALGFLLGGIISPPDAVSATTIMSHVKVPKRLTTLIEGESLLNDASSLIVFRFALASVITGQFYFQEAAASFLWVISMGTLIGLMVGMVFYLVHRYLPTTASIETVLTLVTPYCMYYSAEYFHFSGVLAVVAGGLLLSNKRQSMLNYQSRLEGINVWTSFVFVLNGLVFLLIGLQLPAITQQLDITLSKAIGYGLVISLALVIIRLLCVFGAAVFTRFVSRYIKVADSNPGWRMPMIVGWAGMRGVVSLAAALSIPLLDDQGNAFPFRNLILFITFIVILVTLVFQGLTLPWLIKKVKPTEKDTAIDEQDQEIMVQRLIVELSIKFLEEKYGSDIMLHDHAGHFYSKLKIDLKYSQMMGAHPDKEAEDSFVQFQHHYLDLLERQRKLLVDMNKSLELNEGIIRKYLSLIDLEELKLRENFGHIL